MIIEGAFFKLPEILLGAMSSKRQYEGTVVSHLAMAILLELAARNIPQPMHRIHIEMPYPELRDSKTPGRADLFVDLEGIYSRSVPRTYSAYGMKPANWIEAKLFGRIASREGSETKTSNAGLIALDLMRLCLFVHEERSASRDNARYFLAVFDSEPTEYLAYHRQSVANPAREWLPALLTPGAREVVISISQEPLSIRRLFTRGEQAPPESLDLLLNLNVDVHAFVPSHSLTKDLYWGYLVRVVDFQATWSGQTLTYQDASEELWSEEQEKAQDALVRTATNEGTA